MTTQLSTDLQNAIQKNLPQVVAGELAEYLSQAEKDKKTIIELINNGKSLEERLSAKIKECNELSHYRDLEKSLFAKEKFLYDIEQGLKKSQEIEIVKSICAKEKVDNMFDVMKIVFKSQPVGHAFNKSITSSEYIPGNQSNNYCGQSVNSSSSETTTVKEISE